MLPNLHCTCESLILACCWSQCRPDSSEKQLFAGSQSLHERPTNGHFQAASMQLVRWLLDTAALCRTGMLSRIDADICKQAMVDEMSRRYRECFGEVLRFQIVNSTLWIDHISERHEGWYPAKLGVGKPALGFCICCACAYWVCLSCRDFMSADDHWAITHFLSWHLPLDCL